MNEDDIKLLAGKLPNESIEKEIHTFVKSLKEKDILDLLIPLIDITETRGRLAIIRLLTKNINKHNHLIMILTIGFEKKLVSEINGWIKVITPKLGERKVLETLNKIEDKEARDIVFYHLKFMDNYKCFL